MRWQDQCYRPRRQASLQGAGADTSVDSERAAELGMKTFYGMQWSALWPELPFVCLRLNLIMCLSHRGPEHSVRRIIIHAWDCRCTYRPENRFAQMQ